jgi:MYXO-CTERM domain-containing protein
VGLDGAALTTSSCLLTDPAALLAVADEPRGNGIKLVIGAVFLGAVVALAVVRRRRGTRPQLPGAPGPGPE